MKKSLPVSRAQCCPRRRMVSMLLPVCFIAVVQPGAAMEKGEYPAPALDQFQPAAATEDDVDGDGAKETLIRRYSNAAAQSIFSLTTNDRLWAWSLATADGDSLDPTKSYLIRDSNCDGVFDEKYRSDEDVQIPACLK